MGRNEKLLTRVVLLALFAGFCATAAQAAPLSVDAVKAAYLFRFAQYVEWPASPPDAPFVIAVSGAEEVAVHLERLLPGMTVNGHRAIVRRVTRTRQLEGVHILFVGSGDFSRTRSLRLLAIGRPILIVTDGEGGFDAGGVINFIEVDRDLRFEISLNAADRSGLRINPALLSLAARVERRPQGAINCLDGVAHRQRANGCRMRMAKLPDPASGEYSELSARFAWRASDRLELALKGFNLLNETHLAYPNPAGQAIRRGVVGELRFNY